MSLSQESLGFLAPDPRAGHGRRWGDGSQTSQDAAAPLPCGAGGLADDPSSDAGRGDGSRMFTGAGGDGVPGWRGVFTRFLTGFCLDVCFFFWGGIGNQDGTDHEHVHLEAVMFFLGVLPWQGLFLQSRLDELLFPFIGRHVARTGYSVPGPGGGRHRLWHQRIYPEQLVHLFAGAVVSFFGLSENPKATGPMAKPMSVAIFNGHPLGIKGGWKITNKWRLKMETMELNYPLVI